jgi:predicted O-linked N-acetylglucosamine transferase (SPINDLY family)
VPVVTTPNIPLASRVASSLLQAAGLSELIARNAADYSHLAAALASRPHLLRSLQKKLRSSRDELPLFNSRAYADEFERVIFLFAEAQYAGAGRDSIRGSTMHVAVTDSLLRSAPAAGV